MPVDKKSREQQEDDSRGNDEGSVLGHLDLAALLDRAPFPDIVTLPSKMGEEISATEGPPFLAVETCGFLPEPDDPGIS